MSDTYGDRRHVQDTYNSTFINDIITRTSSVDLTALSGSKLSKKDRETLKNVVNEVNDAIDTFNRQHPTMIFRSRRHNARFIMDLLKKFHELDRSMLVRCQQRSGKEEEIGKLENAINELERDAPAEDKKQGNLVALVDAREKDAESTNKRYCEHLRGRCLLSEAEAHADTTNGILFDRVMVDNHIYKKLELSIVVDLLQNRLDRVLVELKDAKAELALLELNQHRRRQAISR